VLQIVRKLVYTPTVLPSAYYFNFLVTGQNGVGGLFGGGNMMYTIMMMWAVAALALFFMRPASLRRGGDRKPPPDNGNVHLLKLSLFWHNNC